MSLSDSSLGGVVFITAEGRGNGQHGTETVEMRVQLKAMTSGKVHYFGGPPSYVVPNLELYIPILSTPFLWLYVHYHRLAS